MKKLLLYILTTLTLLANSEELYKNCAGCHGENGEISALGQSKLITGQDSNLSVKQLTAYKNGELNQYGLGNIMKVQLITLNKDEIQKLADYIANMKLSPSSN